MAKSSGSSYICSNCGFEISRWLGQCPQCKEWNTLEENFSELTTTLAKTSTLEVLEADKLDSKVLHKLKTGIEEFDRVVGGGLVNSQVLLISGQPGIGKSTVILQILQKLVAQKVPSAYFSAEESAEQVGLRAKRLFSPSELTGIRIVAATEVEAIIGQIKKDKAKFVVLDSIQTVFSAEARGLPGGIAQIKACTSKLVAFAKEHKIMMVIVGQVTKEGAVAGPKLLEHLVDTVLELEGDEKRGLRVLRCLKNRYGSVNEVGLFVMSERGMEEVADPAKYFSLNEADQSVVGVCKAAVVEGNRVLTFEVQALVINSPFSLPKRVSEGIARSRLELLAAILTRHGGVNLSGKDVYLNIAQGFKVRDTASDLAVIAAIYSAAKNIPIKQKIVAVGEVSLSGNIQPPPRIAMIEKELERLGYDSLLKNSGNNRQLKPILASL